MLSCLDTFATCLVSAKAILLLGARAVFQVDLSSCAQGPFLLVVSKMANCLFWREKNSMHTDAQQQETKMVGEVIESEILYSGQSC